MRPIFFLLVFFFPLFALSNFPDSEWPIELTSNEDSTTELEQYLFPKRQFDEQMGPRTEAVLIIKDGKIIYEKYDRDYNKDKKHLLWSISKSFIHLLIGNAVETLNFNPNSSICDHNKINNKKHCAIKYTDIANWSSGLKWLEEYEKAKDPRQSSVLSMLYGEGQKDSGRFLMNHPIQHPPDTFWRYSSGDTNYLAYLMRGVFKKEDLRQVIEEKIFSPLQIKNATIEQDAAGTLLLSSNVYMTARELARIGWLFMNKGHWKNQQILNKQWIENSLKLVKSHIETPEAQTLHYLSGRHFWLNIKNDKVKYPNPWPEAPEDTFASLGHWGQSLFVIPSMNSVIVRYGDTREKKFYDKRLFMKHAVNIIKDYSK